MSLITEQVEKLRELSKQDKLGLIPWNGYSGILNQAADTIEAYQKAFEDIKGDLSKLYASDNVIFGLNGVLEIIDKHNPDKGKERAENGGGWIPTAERLPEDKTYVLVTIQIPGRQPHVRSSWYQNGLFMNDNGDVWNATDKELKAWMLLPEA